MSYQITRSFYLSGALTITRENIIKGIEIMGMGGGAPESSLIEDFIWTGREHIDPSTLPDGDLPVQYPGWTGEGSGSAHEMMRDEVLPLTKGEAEIVFVWEGGDDFLGLRVRDGVVTEHEIDLSLGKEHVRSGF